MGLVFIQGGGGQLQEGDGRASAGNWGGGGGKYFYGGAEIPIKLCIFVKSK